MRLIDADELKKKVYMEEDPYGETKMVVLETDVDEAPTIDAVPVVRCKDCKWWKTNFCNNFDVFGFEGDDYCSLGERRKDETN